jgi:misacylated tRNA(Ala) deacylase
MTELLHMTDNYCRRFEATVTEVLDDGVVLDRTAFYPHGGGVAGDRGMLVAGRKRDVTGTVWRGGRVVHLTDTQGLEKGTKVHGEIEWGRRHRLMRAHTASHLLEAFMFRRTGALIGSGRVSLGRSYIGFTLDEMDTELIAEVVKEANDTIEAGAPVTITFMPREEALEDPEMVKLAGKLPPEVKELRIVTIAGIDRQACGGPHVADIGEIGHIEVLDTVNKGKKNRRLYFDVI